MWSIGERSCTVHNEQKMIFKCAFRVLTKGLKVVNECSCTIHTRARILFTKSQKCLEYDFMSIA
jgi:hypothetical protein